MLPRRALLAALLLPAAPAAAASALRLEMRPDNLAALTGPGLARELLVPGDGARLLPPVACGGAAVSVLAFPAQDGPARVEWAALATALDDRVALLALEPLSWRGPTGARLSTRLVAAGDAHRVLLRRHSAEPLGPTLWRREAWTDMLAWRPPAALDDAPIRPPLPGTHQHAVAAWRLRAAAIVAAQPPHLTESLLAGIASGF